MASNIGATKSAVASLRESPMHRWTTWRSELNSSLGETCLNSPPTTRAAHKVAERSRSPRLNSMVPDVESTFQLDYQMKYRIPRARRRRAARRQSTSESDAGYSDSGSSVSSFGSFRSDGYRDVRITDPQLRESVARRRRAQMMEEDPGGAKSWTKLKSKLEQRRKTQMKGERRHKSHSESPGSIKSITLPPSSQRKYTTTTATVSDLSGKNTWNSIPRIEQYKRRKVDSHLRRQKSDLGYSSDSEQHDYLYTTKDGVLIQDGQPMLQPPAYRMQKAKERYYSDPLTKMERIQTRNKRKNRPRSTSEGEMRSNQYGRSKSEENPPYRSSSSSRQMRAHIDRPGRPFSTSSLENSSSQYRQEDIRSANIDRQYRSLSRSDSDKVTSQYRPGENRPNLREYRPWSTTSSDYYTTHFRQPENRTNIDRQYRPSSTSSSENNSLYRPSNQQYRPSTSSSEKSSIQYRQAQNRTNIDRQYRPSSTSSENNNRQYGQVESRGNIDRQYRPSTWGSNSQYRQADREPGPDYDIKRPGEIEYSSENVPHRPKISAKQLNSPKLGHKNSISRLKKSSIKTNGLLPIPKSPPIDPPAAPRDTYKDFFDKAVRDLFGEEDVEFYSMSEHHGNHSSSAPAPVPAPAPAPVPGPARRRRPLGPSATVPAPSTRKQVQFMNSDESKQLYKQRVAQYTGATAPRRANRTEDEYTRLVKYYGYF